jgi:hypothetical protein
MLVFAQQAMNNDSVVKMIKAGLSDDIIVTTINASPGTYDTSADALIALKTAGASDKVVSAIVLKSSGATAMPAAGQPQQNTQAASVQEPEVMGKIFYLDPSTQTLKQLPGEPWKRKTKQGWGKSKYVDVVAGEHSKFRISAKDRIVFVFKPLPDQQNSNILERILIYSFDVTHDERESVVETVKGGWGGATRQGNPNTVSLQAAKYGSSSFALSPPEFHLVPGEYWVYVPGASGYNDPIITFGVD